MITNCPSPHLHPLRKILNGFLQCFFGTPPKVALLMISFLSMYLSQEIPNPDDWDKFVYSYDNMCHIRKAFKKNYGIFSQTSDPPTLPFGNFDHFHHIIFVYVGNFWVILRCFKGVLRAMVKTTKVLGNLEDSPLPPHFGKIPKNSRFFF